MRINSNIAALNAWRNLTLTDASMGKSLERLSSGYRINRAADDAAGLAVSEKMRGQVRGLNAAIQNAQNGVSLIQTAEGALQETHAILQRMRELAVQARSGTLTDADRGNLQKEFQELQSEINRIATNTEFNTKKLLNGSMASDNAITLQIGANAGQVLTVNIATTNGSALAVDALAIDSASGASTAISGIDGALNTVSGTRANLGALQNRLEHTIANLGVAAENLSAAESRVRDADMAREMTAFTRNQILVQAGTAMLAQSNMKTQAVLQLLR